MILKLKPKKVVKRRNPFIDSKGQLVTDPRLILKYGINNDSWIQDKKIRDKNGPYVNYKPRKQ